MRKDLEKYAHNLLIELEYKKTLTLFSCLIKYVMPEHVNIIKNNLEDKYVLKSILEENCLEISCDITYNRHVEPMTRMEVYCISKFEDGIVYCLDFIEFDYDYSELGEVKLLSNKQIITSIEEI